MLPEMSIASASARSTSFLSWALAGKAKRRTEEQRDAAAWPWATSAVGCGRSGKNHTARRKPRPAARWTGRACAASLCGKIAGGNAWILALSPQDEAFRDEVRRFLDENLTRGLTRGRPQDRRRVRRHRRRPALAQGAGQARLVGADLAHGTWRHRLERHPALHLRARMHRRRRAAHLRHGHPHGRAGDHEVRHARAEGQVPAAGSCRATSCSARAIPSRARAPTSPASRRAPCATATTT